MQATQLSCNLIADSFSANRKSKGMDTELTYGLLIIECTFFVLATSISTRLIASLSQMVLSVPVCM